MSPFRFISPKWLAHRIAREYRRPTTLIGKVLIEKYREWVARNNKISTDEKMLAVYDLQVAPITFNFAEFLVLANLECHSRGLTEYEILLVPRTVEKVLGGEYDLIHDEASKAWRLRQIIMPLVFMSPMCRGVRLLSNRDQISEALQGVQVFPLAYSKNNWQVADHSRIYRELSVEYVGLYPGDQSLRYIDRWIDTHANGRIVISLTIRQQKYDLKRNTRLQEAVIFLHWVKEQGFFPVVIPDTDAAPEGLQGSDGLCVFGELAWNVELRAAFYQRAAMNFFMPNGSLGLAMFNQKVRYAIMGYRYGASAHDMMRMGLREGDNLRFASEGQLLVWSEDSLTEYMRIFQKFRAEGFLG